MGSLLWAEYLKLRTTRTMWALLAAIVALTALSVAASMAVINPNNMDREAEAGLRSVLHVAGSGAIFVLILGIIVTAGEYRQSTAVDTYLTTPRRGRVLVAKLITSMSVGIAFGAVATLVAVITAAISYQLKGLNMPLTVGLVWSTLVGAVVYAALFGGLGASVGSLIRNQILAIVGAIIFVTIVQGIISVINPTLGHLMPPALGRAIVEDPGGEYLAPLPAALLLGLYSALIMLAAALIERRRDA